MRSFILFIGLMSTILSFAGTIDTIPASDPLIEYTGRIDFSNPEAPKFSYSGVSIRACFTGTSIGIIMNDNVGQNYYNVIIDGRLLDTLRATTGEKTYSLAGGLANTTHEIELFKRTEEMFGKTQFFGFVVDEGATLTGLYHIRDRLIEFIGNSITCGYGNEGINGGTFGPTTENHYMTYAAVTSRNFNARHLAVCKSGIGIYRNYAGPSTGNDDCMTNYYTRIFLYDATPIYSFSDQPDLVCIDLGTNDFSTPGGDSALFVNNYFRLIDTIQAKYTMPDIVCLLGPMLSDPTLTQVRNYITTVVDSANNKGKGNVYFFEMSPQTGSLGIGIDYHPTVAQHKKNGMELTEYIKSLKDWDITPLVLNANLTETNHIQLEFNTAVVDLASDYAGFSVFGNDQLCTIDSVIRDGTDHKIIHIWLNQPMVVGEKINLDYSPFGLESEDYLPVGAINYLSIVNTLSETKVTRGTTNNDGTRITLVCNKNLKKNSTLEGLSITDNNLGVLAIDSFQVQNAQLTLFLQESIIKEDSVFADYSGTGILGADGISLTQFEKLVIKNNSTIVSLSENELSPFVIYPNPNHTGILYYRLNGPVVSGKTILEIAGINGMVVYRQGISETEGRIDLRNEVPKGIYILRISLGETIIVKSLAIQ
jgi:hypothetical protein